MLTQRQISGLDVKIETEQRDGYFAARTNPLALTGYGKTERGSIERAIGGVKLWLKWNPQQGARLVDCKG